MIRCYVLAALLVASTSVMAETGRDCIAREVGVLDDVVTSADVVAGAVFQTCFATSILAQCKTLRHDDGLGCLAAARDAGVREITPDVLRRRAARR